jgi:hypothetical protein
MQNEMFSEVVDGRPDAKQSLADAGLCPYPDCTGILAFVKTIKGILLNDSPDDPDPRVIDLHKVYMCPECKQEVILKYDVPLNTKVN